MFSTYLTIFPPSVANTIITERERVRGILPAYFHPSSLIAGGFIASPWKAEDVDVWVSIEGEEFAQHLNGLQIELTSLVDANPFRYRVVLSPSPGGFEETIEVAYLLRGFFVVGTFYEVGKRPIQIILTNAQGGDELIASFDLSCHAIGVGIDTDEVFVHPAYKHPQWGTTILDLTTPLHTLGRYLKLAQRYGWTVDVEMLKPLLGCLQAIPSLTLHSHNNLSTSLPLPVELTLKSGMVA